MPILHALVLGVVQGATEFVPVSSSGHLVLVPFLLGWDEPSVAFDVAVHLGTLASVLWVFRARLAPLVRAIRAPDEPSRRMLTLLFLATLPAAVAGAAFGSVFESAFSRPVLVSLLLGATGYLMLVGDRMIAHHEERVRDEEHARRVAALRGEPEPEVRPLRGEDGLDATDALWIGAAQAVAILPGVSRSGATVVAGLRLGVTRETAVNFSFLLSIPAILGAFAVKLPDLADAGARGELGAIAAGVAASAVTGVIAIRGFIRLFTSRGLRPFAVYCFLAMTAGLVGSLARG